MPDVGELTDRDVAERIRDGLMSSPQRLGAFWLFDLRVTGTGAAYRDTIGEYAVRDPDTWLTDDLVNRCNGLAVTFGHPASAGLNTQEYRQRSIGSIVLPYKRGDELRGVAKIFDDDAAMLMQTSHRSTSPGVTPGAESEPVALPDGTMVLDESAPLIFDHLAVCENGVWDKGGPPAGVRLDAAVTKPTPEAPPAAAERKDTDMADDKDDLKERYDAACAERDDLRKRMDAMEAERKDAKGEERKDAEETEEEADKKAEAESEEEAKKDAKRKDSAKKDAAEEERKDAAPKENIEATEAPIHDAADVKALAAEVDRLRARLVGLERQPTIEDRDQIAAAFHRADSLYQMLGQVTPQVTPGELPVAYRQRLASGLRRFSPRFKSYAFHDSLDAQAFDLIETAIYADALEAAKNPAEPAAGGLREVRTTEHGKSVSRFYGDSRAAWRQFMPPVKTYITRFDQHPNRRA